MRILIDFIPQFLIVNNVNITLGSMKSIANDQVQYVLLLLSCWSTELEISS
jgi:hypothetical protein